MKSSGRLRQPWARASNRKSDSHKARAPETTTREGAAQPSAPSSRNVTVTETHAETFNGSAARTVSNSNIHGSERNRSEETSRLRSHQPPFQAANTPKAPERKLASNAAAGASTSDTRVP